MDSFVKEGEHGVVSHSGGYRQMALYGPFLSALRGMEQDTVQTVCSRLCREPTLFLQEEILAFLVDTVMSLEGRVWGWY